MPDSTVVFDAIARVTDANDMPVSGGSVSFYNAGTLTPKTVYADADLTVSLGSVVATDAGGYPITGGSVKTLVYTGTASYKMIVKDAGGVTLITHDNIKGATVTPTTATAIPVTSVVTKPADYTATVSDQGKLINFNVTSGNKALTLPSAVTAGDGFRIGARISAGANRMTVIPVGGQTITRLGKSASTTFVAAGIGEGVWLVSDGANWHVDTYTPALMTSGLPFFSVTDRLTAAPVSPESGARYIVNGTPTGAWAALGLVLHDVAESDGVGGWIKYTPADGWFAYIADENRFTVFADSAWVDQTGMGAPSAAAIESATFAWTRPQGTAGGTPVINAWSTVQINASPTNNMTGASFVGNRFRLPTGLHLVVAWHTFTATGMSQLRIKSATTASIITGPSIRAENSLGTGQVAVCVGVLNVTSASEEFEAQYYVTSGSGNANTNGLGYPRNISGEDEVYAQIAVLKCQTLQGATGAQGPQGPDGLDAAFPYEWSSGTSGNPGSGKVGGNNGTVSLVTELRFSKTDALGGAMGSTIPTWDDSTSTLRGRIRLAKEGFTNNYHLFAITGAVVDNSTYMTIPVAYVATSGTIADGDDLAVLVTEKGDKGDAGANGTTVPDISGLTVLASTAMVPADKLIIYDLSASGHKAVHLPNPPLVFTDPEFGGVGDDSTDNDTAFSAFINAIVATGRPGYIPAGTYRITNAFASVTPGLSFRLYGDGRRSVIKRMSSSLLEPVLVVNAAAGPAVEKIAFEFAGTYSGSLADADHMALRFNGCRDGICRDSWFLGQWYSTWESRDSLGGDIFHGNHITGAQNRGPYIQTTAGVSTARVSIANNHIDGGSVLDYGININPNPTSTLLDVSCIGNVIYNVTYDGINIAGISHGSVVANIVDNVTDGSGNGIQLLPNAAPGSSQPQFITIAGNKISNVATGIRLNLDVYTNCVGNHIQSTYRGILSTGSNSSAIVGNLCQVSGASAVGIELADSGATAPNACHLASNSIYMTGAGTVGVQSSASSANCSIDINSHKISGAVTDFTILGSAPVTGARYLSGVLTPSALTANANNYEPAGIGAAGILRLSATGAVDLTGISAAPVGGRVMVLANVGANTITLKDDSTASSAANRFALTGDLALTADMAVIIAYDDVTDRWRLVGGGAGGGAVTSVAGRTGAVSLVATDVTDSTAAGRTLLTAADASAQRTALGLVIGTHVQAFDAELSALAGLTSAADSAPYFTGSGTAALMTVTAAARTLLDDASTGAMRATLGLVIGTDVQAFDAELAALAGLTSAADRVPYFTGSGTASLATLTTYGRTLIGSADSAAGRTALGLGSAATVNTGTTGAVIPLLNGTNTWSGVQTLQSVGQPLLVNSTDNQFKIGMFSNGTIDGYFGSTTGVPLTVGTPGGEPIARFVDVAGTLVNYLEFYGSLSGAATRIVAGGSDTDIDLALEAKGAGKPRFAAGSFAANGSVATALSSVGPTGASTTVQEWLAVKNAAGTTRYIPCF